MSVNYNYLLFHASHSCLRRAAAIHDARCGVCRGMEWDLPEGLAQLVKTHLSLCTPTPVQAAALAAVTDPRHDYLLKAPTGSGKTLACLLPALRALLAEADGSRRHGTRIMVVAPTRELALQTHRLVQSILGRLRPHWMTCCVLIGTGGKDDTAASADRAASSRKKEKEQLRRGQTVVVGTPGRLLDHLEKSSGWARDRLDWAILDEADRLMDAGFGPKMRQIMGLLVKRPCVVYCSATVTDPKDAVVELRGECRLVQPRGLDMPASLTQNYMVVPTKHRLALLCGLCKSNQSGRTVVFLSCCDSVDFHHALFKTVLRRECFALHGSLPIGTRTQVLHQYEAGPPHSVLFCTDVAARGLNLGKAVTLIVQYDAPSDRLDYVHRAGRTARASAAGRNILVLHESEQPYVDFLARDHACIAPSALQASDFYNERNWGLWQRELVGKLGRQPEIKALGQRAYSSAIRAYATHPSDERHIFHIKRLHLGHLAASFGLDEKAMHEGDVPTRRRTGPGGDWKRGAKNDAQKRAVPAAPAPSKRFRSVSEFSAF